MSSPYKPGAVVSTVGNLPAGYTALSLSEYVALIAMLAQFPIEQGYIDTLQAQVAVLIANAAHPVYEPVCAGGEIVFSSSGDVVMNFGGYYAS